MNDDENSNESFIKIFGNETKMNENFLNESFSFDSNIKDQNIKNENYTTDYSTLIVEKNEKDNKIFEHEFYENICNDSSDENSQKIEIIYSNDQKNNNIDDEKILYENDFSQSNNIISDENLNQNIIKLIAKKKPARKDYLIKKMLSIISKYLIKKLKEKKNKFKKINLKSELNYEKLKICLNKKIKELLRKNETNEEIINLYENIENLNEILNMELIYFIIKNYETLNNQYKYYYYNEFKLKFENAKLFENLDSIKKIINEIYSTKGNKMKKKDQ